MTDFMWNKSTDSKQLCYKIFQCNSNKWELTTVQYKCLYVRRLKTLYDLVLGLGLAYHYGMSVFVGLSSQL